jgi:sugar O-acyltransferase (sialic acid O-acetyltransferase NeuD family)
MNTHNLKPVYVPLLNPNERDAQLVAIYVKEGDQVEDGYVICILETTKSTAEVTAESTGYIVGLRFEEGQTVSAGDILCHLSESLEEIPTMTSISNNRNKLEDEESSSTTEIPVGLRITKPALALANQNEVDLSQLPIGPLITEEQVRNLLRESAEQYDYPVIDSDFNPTSIIIYGGGGHGKTLIELIRAMGVYQIVGIIDDGIDKNSEILNIPVLGGNEMLPVLYSSGVHLSVNAVGGVGDNAIRIEVFQRLGNAGYVCPPVLHPTAYIEPSATLSPGVQVFSQAYLGSEVKIGYGVIINTGAIVSHGCTIGDYTHISPGAILAGDVMVGNDVLVGMGATVNLGVIIGNGVRIGNGATIKEDVPENSIIKAGTIWPR